MRVVRRVRTGKRPSADYRLGEEAFALAARSAGSGVKAELVYLADGHEPVPLVFKEAALAKKAEQIAQTLRELGSGLFPDEGIGALLPVLPGVLCLRAGPGRGARKKVGRAVPGFADLKGLPL